MFTFKTDFDQVQPEGIQVMTNALKGSFKQVISNNLGVVEDFGDTD
jgi:hypothetical protein